jgi:Tfp pilus assembly protein PilF
LNLAILLVKIGQRDEAAAHFREALRIKPDDPSVRAQLRQLEVER